MPRNVQEPPRIVVADDEAIVRQVIVDVLRGIGCEVVAVGTGPALLADLRQHAEATALIVLDMVMPGMAVSDLLAELRALAPGIPVVVVTGHIRDDYIRDPLGNTAAAVIEKPFEPGELLQIVTRLLDVSRSPAIPTRSCT